MPQNETTAMRCDHCRHWFLDPEDSYRAIPGIKECRKAVQLWDATEWVEDEPDEDGDLGVNRLPKDSTQMSFVQDGSDYMASLWTKPEFFCAHFEAVETNNER